MPCENYSGMIICRGRERRRRCPCGSGEWIEFECDFPVGAGTCDAKLCRRCATRITGGKLDYCRAHKEQALAKLREQSGKKVADGR